MAQDVSDSQAQSSGVQKKKVSKKKAAKTLDSHSPKANSDSKDVNGTSPHPSSGSSGAISWLALLIALLGLGAGGYVWYQNNVEGQRAVNEQTARLDGVEQRISSLQQGQNDLEARDNQIKGQLLTIEESVGQQIRTVRAELVEQQSTVSEQINTAQKSLNKQEQVFKDEFTALSDSIVSLRTELGKNAQSWKLEEAEQLVFIANQRLYLAGESDLAMQALKLADSQLAQVSKPEVVAIRQQLAEEIAALSLIETPDVVGMLAAIGALSDSLQQLPLPGDIETLVDGDAQIEGNADEKGDHSQAQTLSKEEELGEEEGAMETVMRVSAQFISDLSDLVQIEKRGEKMAPVVSAEIAFMTVEKTQLMLEAAQISYLRQQYEAYSQRMEAIDKWVRERFAQGNQRESWLAQLDQLSSEIPSNQQPDISGSLESIRALIERG